MKKSILLFLTIVAVQMSLGSIRDQTKKVEDVINKLEKAIQTSNFEIIKPFIDEEFLYGGISCGSSNCESVKNLFKNIVNDYPESIALKSIEITQISKEGSDYSISTLFHYVDKANLSKKQEIILTNEAKLFALEIPYLKVKIGGA
ncbi:hypothetical protein KAR48_08590 [bacterium]|nr:hypothetical protein [bacterium]